MDLEKLITDTLGEMMIELQTMICNKDDVIGQKEEMSRFGWTLLEEVIIVDDNKSNVERVTALFSRDTSMRNHAKINLLEVELANTVAEYIVIASEDNLCDSQSKINSMEIRKDAILLEASRLLQI